jgi:N6-adenosine-specific RNA methylase IME4
LAACESLGIKPKIIQSSSKDHLAIWTSLNLRRTHLSQNEKALIAAELYRLRPKADNGKKMTQEQICQKLEISDDTVDRVRKALKLAKDQGIEAEVIEQIKQGRSPRQVKRDLEGEKIAKLNLKTYLDTNLKLAHELHAMAQTNQQYSFIYADPPWAEAVPNAPYPTMPTGKDGDVPNPDGTCPTVCAMADDIKKLAAKDSVLWLWTTSSLLQNGLRVMEAWGFKYVTMIVWAKSKHNASKGAVLPKHELILVGKIRNEKDEEFGEDQDIVLVAKRGTGLGTPKHPIDSVFELPVQKLVHSQKPEEFAKAAEGLYPTKAKLELFARRARDGWTTWGNQSDGKALQQLQAKARSGGHQKKKSATAGMAEHRGRGRPRKVQPASIEKLAEGYEECDEFNRTKNILLNPGV